VANAYGSSAKQITNYGCASFAPTFTPDGKKLLFSSNKHKCDSRDFELYLINTDGTGLEQVTMDPAFDGFPMFSPDGKKLVFASNRNDKNGTDTNLFIADWVW
jgi:Tol biopolymer transport system component